MRQNAHILRPRKPSRQGGDIPLHPEASDGKIRRTHPTGSLPEIHSGRRTTARDRSPRPFSTQVEIAHIALRTHEHTCAFNHIIEIEQKCRRHPRPCPHILDRYPQAASTQKRMVMASNTVTQQYDTHELTTRQRPNVDPRARLTLHSKGMPKDRGGPAEELIASRTHGLPTGKEGPPSMTVVRKVRRICIQYSIHTWKESGKGRLQGLAP